MDDTIHYLNTDLDLSSTEDLKALAAAFEEQGLSHQQVAKAVGIGRSTVSNSLRLLELEDDMLAAVSSGRITEGHARSLLAESDPGRRRQLFQEVLEGKVTVREAEEKARPARRKKKARKRSAEAGLLERGLAEALGMKVQITERGKAGKVVIHYKNLEEFDELHRRITGNSPEL